MRVTILAITGETSGTIHELKGEWIFIGRLGAQLSLHDKRCSRRHALIYQAGPSRLRVRDLESTNGTWVDGERVGDHPLSVGDEFQVGETTLKVISADFAFGDLKRTGDWLRS